MILPLTREASILQFAPCFTQTSFQTFGVIVTGWLLTRGRRVVTRILRAGDGLEVKSFSCDHRFFSQGRWSPDEIGRVMLGGILKFILPNAPIVVVDDTLNCVVGQHLLYTDNHPANPFSCVLGSDPYRRKSWDEDRKRCREAKIPDEVTYHPKWQIALDQAAEAQRNGVRFSWVTFDEEYCSVPMS